MNRRRFLWAGSASALSAVAGPLEWTAVRSPTAAGPARYVGNPDLLTLLPADQWPGTPMGADGRFQNHEFPLRQSFGAVLRWQTQRNPQRAEKRADPFRQPVVQTD